MQDERERLLEEAWERFENLRAPVEAKRKKAMDEAYAEYQFVKNAAAAEWERKNEMAEDEYDRTMAPHKANLRLVDPHA